MDRTRSVRIVSAGRSARDAQVFDAETGAALSGVVSLASTSHSTRATAAFPRQP